MAIYALIARLVALGVTTSTRIFVGNRATLPSKDSGIAFLTISATGGVEAWGTHNAGSQRYRRPSWQFVARAPTYAAAETLANEAHAALAFQNTTVSGIAFLKVRPEHEPFELPLDSEGRARVAFNVNAEHAA